MEPLSSKTPNQDGQEINIEEQLFKILRNWKWILLSMALALLVAYLYIRYTVPQYGMSTTILIKDEKKGASALDAFNDLGLVTSSKGVNENEVAILQSRTLSENVVRQLEFNITYFVEGIIISPEAYQNSPVKILFTEKNESFYKKDTTMVIQPQSDKKFLITNSLKKNPKEYSFGQKITTGLGTFVIINNSGKNIAENDITIKFNSVSRVAASYNRRVGVETVGKKSSILKLSLTDPIQKKGIDYLDALVQQFNDDAAEDRNLISRGTSKFIESRLAIITRELDSVEKGVEVFKKDNRLTDLSSDASLSLSSSASYEKSVVDNETSMKILDYMLEVVNKGSDTEPLPSNVIPSGASAGLITEYNKLILDRTRVLKTASASNPYIINLDSQLRGLRSNLMESLINEKNSMRITQKDLKRQENIFGGKVLKVPTNERAFNAIDRQQKIKESLYLYLLQKREETAISLAVTSPKAKTIDAAYSNGLVSPNTRMIFTVALFIGLVLPIGFIVLIGLLDNKIHSRQDVVKQTDIPYLGDIPLSEDEKLGISDSRSSTAESFRIILTNLEFMLSQTENNKAKSIFITSTLPKEGKTFVSINLSKTLAQYGRKVLLVGMDLRHPKFSDYLDVNSGIGVSNYLSSDKLSIADITFKQEGFKDFWVMPSGAIPPNPAELLNSSKVKELFDTIKNEYDYIVVDTAPVSLVTDTLLLNKFADVFVYVVRANYLKKNSLGLPESLHQEGKLPNMSILLNGISQNRGYGYGHGYGYGYGYGYGQEMKQKNWFEKMFKKN